MIRDNFVLDKTVSVNLKEEMGNIATGIGLFLLGNTICKI